MEYKRTSVAYLLWFLLGPFGGHRFYLGQTGWGLFFVFTFGVFVIGWVIDFFMIPAYVESFNRRVDFLRGESCAPCGEEGRGLQLGAEVGRGGACVSLTPSADKSVKWNP